MQNEMNMNNKTHKYVPRNRLEKAFIYTGCKQICLSTGNDLATFRVSLTE